MITVDNELREHLEQMCQFAKTVSAQVGAVNLNQSLTEYKAVIIVNQYGGASYLEVANRLIDQLEANSDIDEDQKELTKALLVLAASLMAGLVDENFNIIA